jgi:K(+)-stimulated pyrophosphate-energized sodium pump
MIASGALVILSPLVLVFAFGPTIIAGFLQGAIVNGVKMAISAVNTGGAGDHDKKYNESGVMIDENGKKAIKGSDIYKAAVVGDTVGYPYFNKFYRRINYFDYNM